MTLLDVLDVVLLGVLGAAFAAAVARAMRDGSLADKILGADTATTILATGVAAAVAVTGVPYYLDVIVIIAGLAFVGTLTVARFIEHRGAAAPPPPATAHPSVTPPASRPEEHR